MSDSATPLVGEISAQQASRSRGSANARTKYIVGGLFALLIVVAAVMTMTGGSGNGGGDGEVFTIPAGAYKNITTPGIDSAIVLPTVFVLKKDDTAAITIVNNDTVDHRARPFLVGAGQTYTQRFPEPGQYAINCSVNAAESITVTVEG